MYTCYFITFTNIYANYNSVSICVIMNMSALIFSNPILNNNILTINDIL